LLRIRHAIGGEFYEPAAERHTEFSYPRFIFASFVSAYHRPSGFKCPLQRG